MSESLIEQSTENLAIKLAELKIQEQQGYLSEERKAHIRKSMAHISFELTMRAKS